MENNIRKLLIKKSWKGRRPSNWIVYKEVRTSPFDAHFHWWPSPLRPQPFPHPEEKKGTFLKRKALNDLNQPQVIPNIARSGRSGTTNTVYKTTFGATFQNYCGRLSLASNCHRANDPCQWDQVSNCLWRLDSVADEFRPWIVTSWNSVL